MTTNIVIAVTLRYFTESGIPVFQHITASACKKESSRSLSHLLMSFLLCHDNARIIVIINIISDCILIYVQTELQHSKQTDRLAGRHKRNSTALYCCTGLYSYHISSSVQTCSGITVINSGYIAFHRINLDRYAE